MELREGSAGLPVILSNDFDDMFDRLVQSNRMHKSASVLVQIYASWIMHNALWQNAKNSYYIDIETGREYKELEDAHESRRQHLRYQSRRLYESQRIFLKALRGRVPFFNVNTFFSRHKVIMSELRVWALANQTDNIPEEMFARVCEDVILYGKGISGELASAFFSPDSKGELHLKEGALLGPLDIDKGVPEEELGVAVAKKLTSIITEAHSDIRDGASSTSVGRRLRRQILSRGTITPYVGDHGRIGMYYEPAEAMEDGISILEPPVRYLIKIFDEDGIEVYPPDLWDDVRQWLGKSFRIPNGVMLTHQPWES